MSDKDEDAFGNFDEPIAAFQKDEDVFGNFDEPKPASD